MKKEQGFILIAALITTAIIAFIGKDMIQSGQLTAYLTHQQKMYTCAQAHALGTLSSLSTIREGSTIKTITTQHYTITTKTTITPITQQIRSHTTTTHYVIDITSRVQAKKSSGQYGSFSVTAMRSISQ